MIQTSHQPDSPPETQTSENPKPRPSRKGIPQTHKLHQKRNSHDPELATRKPRPLELVPYGELILIEIDRSRFLTNGQIGELLFRRGPTKQHKPRAEAQYQKFANLSIRDLLAMNLIEKVQIYQTHRQTGNVFQDGVNILSPKGLTELKKIHERQDSVEPVRSTPALRDFSFRKIDHELAITNIQIALRRATWSLGPDCDVLDFHDDDQLSRLKGLALFSDFTPDGWCVVQTPEGLFPLFIEADRGTEVIKSTTGSTKDWFTKMTRYSNYHSHRYHADPLYRNLGYDTRAIHPPLILTVTTGHERQAHMLNATAEAGCYGSYWFTTKAELFGTPDMDRSPFGAILEPIWKRLKTGESVDLRSHLTS